MHGALAPLCGSTNSKASRSAICVPRPRRRAMRCEGAIVLAPPAAVTDRWARRLSEPVVALASGWMRVRQRAKSRGVELPLVISDHADWDELNATVDEVGAPEVWVTHGREEALIHCIDRRGIRGRALRLVGYGDEDDEGLGLERAAARSRAGRVIAFADLLERLVFTPSRNAKIALLRRYFATQPDPDRGIGLAAITGELVFHRREARLDPRPRGRAHRPELFAWSYDYVGDLAETSR